MYFKKLRSAVSEPPAWPKSLGFSDSRHISPIRDGVGLLEFTIAIQNTNARPAKRKILNQIYKLSKSSSFPKPKKTNK
jgi:hypothetical protein